MTDLPEFILAIDCGSTNFKAALFDAELTRLGESSIDIDYLSHTAGRYEIDGDHIWQSTVSLINDLCKSTKVQPPKIAILSITSQANTFALLDGESQLLTPFFSWLDERAQPEADELYKIFGPEFHRHVGCAKPLAGQLVSQLLQIQHHEPQLLERTTTVCHLPQFIIYKISGVHAIDRNLAAMCGLYSLQNSTWWTDMLQTLSISQHQLPLLVDVGGKISSKRICDEIPFNKNLKITLAGNDQTAGAYANQCHEGPMVVTLGTALVAYRYAGKTAGPYSEEGMWGPYPDNGYYELGFTNYGCNALNWAKEQLLPDGDINEFFALAMLASNRTDRTLFFYPDKMETAFAWVGEGTPAEKALAVVQGVSFSLRNLIESSLEINNKPSEIYATGGGSRSSFWLQLLSNIIGCPVVQSTEDALAGAANMAASKNTVRFSSKKKLFVPGKISHNQLFKKWISAWDRG